MSLLNNQTFINHERASHATSTEVRAHTHGLLVFVSIRINGIFRCSEQDS